VKKTLKIFAIALGGLLALLLITAVTLTFVFDPNQYKGEVIRIVKDHTGRDLKIEKKISWSLFPRLGLEAGGLELANAPGFGPEPFARIGAAGVRVELWPLLRGRVAVDTVYLYDLTLNLAKNPAGKTNWDDLLAASKEAKPAKPEPKPAGTADQKLPLETFTVGKLDIRRANLAWHDQAAGSTLALRNLELATGKFVSGEPVDLRLAFELARDQAPAIKLALGSKLTASPDELKLAHLNLAVDDSRLTGTLGVRNFASPAFQFDLALDQIDIDRYLSKPADKPAAEPKPTSAPATPAKPAEPPLAALRSLDVQGKLRIQQLKAFNLRSSDAQVQITAKGGLITLGPNQAKLYSGGYRGQTVMDARGKTLALNLDETLNNVQLAPLMKDLYGFDNLQGAANLNAKLTAQGFDAGQIKSSLNGNANFAVKDGTIKGVDLKKMADTINAAIKQKTAHNLGQLVPAKGDETKFTQLGGTARVTDGVARNDDLKLQSPNLVNVSGQGSADLPREQLDYTVTIGSVPLRITGPFSDLKFAPDLKAVGKQAVEQKLEGKKDELGKKLLEKYRQRK
jgi:AsmA protein